MGVLNLLAFQGIKNDSGHLLDLNPNKAGLFKGSFSWDWGRGVSLIPSSYFKKN